MIEEILKKINGFDWDWGNVCKNAIKHRVDTTECESVFFNKPLLLFFDQKHSQNEERFYVLGKTNFNRNLFIVFTIRNNKIRIISARDMSRKERKIYEKEDTKIQE